MEPVAGVTRPRARGLFYVLWTLFVPVYLFVVAGLQALFFTACCLAVSSRRGPHAHGA